MRQPPPPHGLDQLPGHAIRRLHQIAVGIFHQETQALNLTPVQFSVLHTVAMQPGIDQRTLASAVALDTSTTAGVVDRLESRGLMVRKASAQDKRVRLLSLTGEGHALLAAARPAMLQAQELILAPLAPAERTQFMQMLQRLVTENNALSRAPSEPLP
jgi:MarR family transcriptional regulator, lower aerobic nicotinate degradation pathway regulator